MSGTSKASLDQLETYYVKDFGTGKMFQIVTNPNGEEEYLPAEPALSFLQIGGEGSNKWIAVRDTAEAEAQRQQGSQNRYFQHIMKDNANLKEGEKLNQVRHNLRRLEAMEKLNTDLAMSMVTPGPSADVKTVKDQEFERLMTEYRLVALQGGDKEARNHYFQPVASYARKLITKSGKVLRPLLQGEIGMVGTTIYTLEEGVSRENRTFVAADLAEK